MAKTKQTISDSGATLGFEDKLWHAAELEKAIRKNLKAIGLEVG